MILRVVAAALLLLVGAYVTYAVTAGYVGALPTPASFAVALGLIAIVVVAVGRLLRPSTGAQLPEPVGRASAGTMRWWGEKARSRRDDPGD